MLKIKFVDTTFHIKFPNIISGTTCDFCEQNISKLKGIEIELSVITQNYERSYTSLSRSDVLPYIRDLWMCHLMNDLNRIDLLKFKEREINREVKKHLVEAHNTK